jgi:hypothetical protein
MTYTKQWIEEIEAIKEALEWQFECLSYPITYKYVKNQLVDIVLTSRQSRFKKKIQRGWSPTLKLHKGSLKLVTRVIATRGDNWKGPKIGQYPRVTK